MDAVSGAFASRGTTRVSTVREVAKAAGVHFTTVSRALRDDPSIPTETRARIRAVANKLGYRMNPVASAMMARRRKGAEAPLGTIAFIRRGDAVWTNPVVAQKYRESWAGAVQRGQQLGFAVEKLTLAEYRDSLPALLRVLRARGVRGIALGGLTVEQMATAEYDHFAVISTVEWSNIPALRTDHFHNVRIACQHLAQAGFRRLAFVPWPLASRALIDVCTAAAWHATERAEGRFAARVLSPHGSPGLRGELREFKPDAVVVSSYMPEFSGPQYLYDTWTGGPAGVSHRRRELAMQMVSWLVSMISLNQFGLPALPLAVQVPGVWQDGPLLQRS